MKTNTIYISIILLLITLLCAVQYQTSITKAKYDDLQKALVQKDTLLKREILSNGKLVTTHTQREYQLATLLSGQTKELQSFRETLKDLQIPVKNVVNSTTIYKIMQDTIVSQIVQDTMRPEVYHFDASDRFLKTHTEFNLVTKEVKLDYKVTDTLQLVSYKWRKNFFHSYEMRIKTVSSNPKANITLQTYSIKTPNRRFVVSLGLGYGAVLYQNKVVFAPFGGLTIGYRIFSL